MAYRAVTRKTTTSALITDMRAALAIRPFLTDRERAEILNILLDYGPPTPDLINSAIRARLATIPEGPDEAPPPPLDRDKRARLALFRTRLRRDYRRTGGKT